MIHFDISLCFPINCATFEFSRRVWFVGSSAKTVMVRCSESGMINSVMVDDIYTVVAHISRG